jgi:hypothetical protein
MGYWTWGGERPQLPSLKKLLDIKIYNALRYFTFNQNSRLIIKLFKTIS